GATGPDGLPRLTAQSDVLNRATRQADARGNVFTSAFTQEPASGWRTTTTKDTTSGTTTVVQFDALNRPVTETDALGRTTAWAYSPASDLALPTSLQLPDARRPAITFGYDTRGNLLTAYDPANDPDGNRVTERFTYDAVNNLT